MAMEHDAIGLVDLDFWSLFAVSGPDPINGFELVAIQSGEPGGVEDSMYRHDLNNEQEARDLVHAPVLGLSLPQSGDVLVGLDMY